MSKDIDFDYTKVKIKQEKPSPPRKKEPEELIDEIIPTLFNNQSNTPEHNAGTDDKKNVEPVKSSNEILAELFKVFNAAPPKILLDDDILKNKKHKHKKKHKKEKKLKKKLKRKGRSSSDEDSGSEEDSPKESKHKKKKRKKSKHSEHHHKKRKTAIKEENIEEKSLTPQTSPKKASEDSEFSISDYDENDLPVLPIIKIKTEKIDTYENKVYKKSPLCEDRHKHSKDSYHKTIGETNKVKDEHKKSKSHKKSSSNVKSTHSKPKDVESEISLSDEETYLKEKENYNKFYGDRRNDDLVDSKHSDSKRGRPKTREDNEFYRGSRMESRDRAHNRKGYRSSSRNRYTRSRWGRSRSRSCGRSTSRSRELGIDKKRLLEIARKNVISMFKKGALPGTNEMSQDIKDKVLMKMRYGGKTVEDLTDFCKKLSNGENLNELSDLSSNEECGHDKDGNEKAFVHHPFVLKDRAPIVMNIKNSVPIQPKSAEETKALLMQFPVSSGQQHRLNESEWVPVTATKTEVAPKSNQPSSVVPTPAKRMIQQQLSSQIPKTIFGKSIPTDQKQQPAFMPLNQSNTPPVIEPETNTNPPEIVEPLNNPVPEMVQFSAPIHPEPVPLHFPVPPPPPPPIIPTPIPNPIITTAPPPVIVRKDVPLNPTIENESIFPQQQNNMDVAAIITKRLNAMRRLQENPMDAEALKIMYNAQKDMSTWASTKQMPGQFTGSTGVNILSARELSGGVQAWAKRDQLMSTAPVSGGIGMHLLQKMGWKPGEGLGRERNGALQPLLLEVKLDKRGVMATEEDSTKRRAPQQFPKKVKKVQNPISQAKLEIESKHPVSLLGEIATKKRWTPPVYDLVDDKGPSHNKAFIFKVVVNNVVYQPSLTSTTKKAAKAVAAKYCLQQMGVLSTADVNN